MYAERLDFYREIEKFTDSKVICYVTGDRQNMEIQIADDVLEHIALHVDKIGICKKISLILYSGGGNTLSGWSLVNLIKQFCIEFNMIIPSKAHSTATLMALGANSILMTKQATLGPIDPSVNGPLNPVAPGGNDLARIPVSVESINGYLEFAKSVGIKGEPGITQLVLDLASKINPVVLGNVYRSRSQIRMLGRRLLAGHMDDQDKIDKILDFLCSESGSHDYTINRREARDELGLQIEKPNDSQYLTIRNLHQDYVNELELLTPFDPNLFLGANTKKSYSMTRGIIESIEGGSTKFVSRGILERTRVQVGPMPHQVQEAVEDRRTFEGWINE